MDKNKIKDDMAFREKCSEYGLSWERFQTLDELIIVPSPNNDLVVVLDENYNVLGFTKKSDYNDVGLYMQGIKRVEFAYNNSNNLPYPFENYSIKQIVDLANRISIHETNHGHSFDMMVNGELLIDDKSSLYVMLLSYIKFLGKQIEQYHKNLYQMKMMGFDYPNIYKYLSILINKIDECIDDSIRRNKRVFPIDIIKYLGQDRDSIHEYNHELYGIIDLVLKQKGYAIKGYDVIEKRDEVIPDLNELSCDLLKILEVPYEEVLARYQDSRENYNMQFLALTAWLQEEKESHK